MGANFVFTVISQLKEALIYETIRIAISLIKNYDKKRITDYFHANNKSGNHVTSARTEISKPSGKNPVLLRCFVFYVPLKFRTVF